MGILGTIYTASSHLVNAPTRNKDRVSKKILECAYLDAATAIAMLGSSPTGLTLEEVEKRRDQFGANEVAQEKRHTFIYRLLDNIRNPLVILLSGLALVAYLTEDLRSTIVIASMVVLGIVLRFAQETRADRAAEELKAMVSTTATVTREGARREIPLTELVPGDIIALSAGDMVPADVRLLNAKDLFLNQAALTGESMPVEKFSAAISTEVSSPLDLNNTCFLGSNVEVGSGMAIVVNTGGQTYFGNLASGITSARQVTSFDKGINQVTWLMIRFMLVMVPLVFLFNILRNGNWLEAFFFALAIAVGLTPEMLPMIVTVNLSKGAIAMSKKKVIIKRLNAIQNFGAMDVLCTDKTGTITQGKIVLEKHLDVKGNESLKVLHYGYLNSYYQTGLKNLLDIAVLDHLDLEQQIVVRGDYQKLDEIPFDFSRRRMSVVVEDHQDNHILICKGAVEEIMGLCTYVEMEGEELEVLPPYDSKLRRMIQELNRQGFRVVAIAYKKIDRHEHGKVYGVQDESGLTLLGFLAFLDPPKESAAAAIEKLARHSVGIKILTGDNEVVTSSISRQVGLSLDRVLLGAEIESISEDELAEAAEETTVFAKLSPIHKQRIIRALQHRGHVVGFMGDGINDAAALKTADVGISVNSAVDIAKESSDIILLENNLLVLEQGVLEGRKVFGNILKYIKMAASSNFGNMFSVLGGSLFLPFLPMLPIQVLTNNLLYDFSQTAIPTDNVDVDWLTKPRKWTTNEIGRYILCMGPISSIFDYLTFFIMLTVFHAWNNPTLFHSGWFVESLFTQTLIIHVIRTNRIPFLQSRSSRALTVASLAVVAAGAFLTISPLASTLGLIALPPLYWLLLVAMLLCYVLLTQLIKSWYSKKFGE